MLIQKICETKQERVSPEAEDLAAVARFALRDVSPDDYFFGRMFVCNDQVDRSHEQFPVSYLKRFAETLPGKSVMPGHDYSQMPIGRFYDASVKKTGDANHLVGRYFIDAKDERTVRGIELGVLKDVSIGFRAGGRQCNLCEKEYVPWFSFMSASEKAASAESYCEHEPGKSYNGQTCTLTYTQPKLAEAMETSFVWLGCQYDANTTRSGSEAYLAKLLAGGVPYANDPRLNTALRGDLMKTVEELEKALLEVQAQLAERDTLLKSLQPLADESGLYRSWLRSEIKRLYDSAEMSDTGAAILKALENAPAEVLESTRKEADKMHQERFAPVGGGQTKGAPPDEPPPPARGFDPTRPRPLWRNQ